VVLVLLPLVLVTVLVLLMLPMLLLVLLLPVMVLLLLMLLSYILLQCGACFHRICHNNGRTVVLSQTVAPLMVLMMNLGLVQ